MNVFKDVGQVSMASYGLRKGKLEKRMAHAKPGDMEKPARTKPLDGPERRGNDRPRRPLHTSVGGTRSIMCNIQVRLIKVCN